MTYLMIIKADFSMKVYFLRFQVIMLCEQKRQTILSDSSEDISKESDKLNISRQQSTASLPICGDKDAKWHLARTLEQMQLQKEPMTILLVFPHDDAQLKAFQTAARRLRIGEGVVDVAKTADEAVSLFLAKNHDLVIIDHRPHNVFTPAAVCKSIRGTRVAGQTVIIALLKALGGREEESIKTLMKVGFNRRLYENTNVTHCENELLMIESSDYANSQRLTCASALFAALDKVQEAVEITDENFRLEYVNPAHEKSFGYTHEDIIGKDLREVLSSDKNNSELYDNIQNNLRKGKHWEGSFFTKRKCGTHVRHRGIVAPVFGRGGNVRHLVSVKACEAPTPGGLPKDNDSSSKREELDLSDGTRNSIYETKLIAGLEFPRPRSTGGSMSRRRESIARLSSMTTIEAPITQVINIINAAQANSSPNVAQALDKVLELLQTTDLYAAINKTGREDKMTSALIDGLMTSAKMMNDKIERRRCSIEPGFGGSMKRLSRVHDGMHEHIRQTLDNPTPKRTKSLTTKRGNYSNNQVTSQHQIQQNPLTEIPDEVVSALEGDEEWNYDVLNLERVSNKRVLVHLAMKIFERFGIMQYLNCSESVMRNWLHVVEENYHYTNRYHNASHAADVLQSSAYFLDRERIKTLFDDVDEVSSLLAAVVHDLDHPGRTNPFLINSQHRLALLYNDIGVLENHHVSLAFQLSTAGDHVNIFKNVEKETYRSLRQNMIDLVLATEMAKHFEHLSRFVNNVAKPMLALQEDDSASIASSNAASGLQSDEELMIAWSTPENRSIIKRMLIKCSDVSNPCRPFHLCEEWGLRIADEYFSQTDEEKDKQLPVVMPMFDRTTCSIPKSQISFIDLFIKDLYESWNAFCDVSVCVDNLNRNYETWQERLAALQLSKDDAEAVTLPAK